MLKNKKGQGLIEYIILVALIAIAAIGISEILGNTIRVKLANITSSLKGGSAKKWSTEKTTKKHVRVRGLDDFHKSARK